MKHYGDALLITEDGTIITLDLPANRDHFAEYAAAVLRCSAIKPFDLTTGVTLWIDEEGPASWPYNRLVDSLVNLYGFTNSLHGPVLITGYGTYVEPLPAETISLIFRELNSIDD
ncbi:hypothetical protein [Streptomyces sp. NPDC058548]|uniref:hypothetical protein n=1 Tax=Streptomyces sp. NPDC058548 TaxID=3346545 RepID=UPI00364B9587